MTEEKPKETIVVKKVAAPGERLLDAESTAWQSVSGMTIETGATPLANQPSPYIKGTFNEEKIGAVKKLTVRSVHNGSAIFFFFEWESLKPNTKIEDINTFPDGVAVLLPFKNPDDTPIKEMGTKDFPTNSWYWRPDFQEKPKNQVAHGLSTSIYTEKSSLASHSKWNGGRWRVVIGRPLAVPEEAVRLAPGIRTTVGFAVWEGANGERGGVKAFSKEWRYLVLES